MTALARLREYTKNTTSTPLEEQWMSKQDAHKLIDTVANDFEDGHKQAARAIAQLLEALPDGEDEDSSGKGG